MYNNRETIFGQFNIFSWYYMYEPVALNKLVILLKSQPFYLVLSCGTEFIIIMNNCKSCTERINQTILVKDINTDVKFKTKQKYLFRYDVTPKLSLCLDYRIIIDVWHICLSQIHLECATRRAWDLTKSSTCNNWRDIPSLQVQ